MTHQDKSTGVGCTPYAVEDSSDKRRRYAYDVVCNGRSYARCETIEDAKKVADAFNNAKALAEALKTHEQWLVERIEWLRKEAHSGGNWEHLKARIDESAYVLQKFRAALSLTESR